MHRPSVLRLARAAAWGAPLLIWSQLATGCGGASAQRAMPAQAVMAPSSASSGTTVAGGEAATAAAPAPAPGVSAHAAMASALGTGPAGHVNGSHAAGSTPAEGATAGATQGAAAPMLVYVAEVEMQTDRGRVTATLDQVVEVACAMGGYLGRRTDTSVQVRLPSARFREGLGRVEGLGEVLHRSVTADDVSEEYRDVEVRLQNLRAVRHRLEEFLARAGGMQDALAVERELERITREIDTLEGRMRYLGARVAFSQVTVTVQPRPEVIVAAAAPSPTAQRRVLDLPVEWLGRLGLDQLLQTR